MIIGVFQKSTPKQCSAAVFDNFLPLFIAGMIIHTGQDIKEAGASGSIPYVDKRNLLFCSLDVEMWQGSGSIKEIFDSLICCEKFHWTRV